MDATLHVAKDLNSFLFLCMRRLKIEEATDHCQIVLDPMMNFSQKCFFSFFAGAQLRRRLFGCFRLLHETEN